MAMPEGLRVVEAISTVRAADGWSSATTSPMSGMSNLRTARRSSTLQIRPSRASSPTSRSPRGTLSHKVRVENGVMLVNREVSRSGERIRASAAVSRSSTSARRPGRAHRDLGGARHASLHVRRPLRLRLAGNGRLPRQHRCNPRPQGSGEPEEVGRWWMPGQWTAGGETPTWEGADHRCHHPMRHGNRLYVSYWHGGFVILDIEDMTKPKFVSGLDWSPPFIRADPHRAAVPFPLRGRRIMLVADEDVVRLGPASPAFLWLVDITDETGRSRSPASRWPRRTARRNRSSPAATSSARTSAAPRFRSPGSPTVSASSTSPTRTLPRGRLLHAGRAVRGQRVQSNDVCFDDRGSST